MHRLYCGIRLARAGKTAHAVLRKDQTGGYSYRGKIVAQLRCGSEVLGFESVHNRGKDLCGAWVGARIVFRGAVWSGGMLYSRNSAKGLWGGRAEATIQLRRVQRCSGGLAGHRHCAPTNGHAEVGGAAEAEAEWHGGVQHQHLVHIQRWLRPLKLLHAEAPCGKCQVGPASVAGTEVRGRLYAAKECKATCSYKVEALTLMAFLSVFTSSSEGWSSTSLQAGTYKLWLPLATV